MLIWICKLTKNADLDKYNYTGSGIEFDSRSEFAFTGESYGKNVVIFGADMRSFVLVDNKGKDILILVEGLTQGLDDATLTAEAKYPINLTQSGKRFVLSLHYTKVYQFKLRNKRLCTVFRWYFKRLYN